jgi:hypothetical protein
MLSPETIEGLLALGYSEGYINYLNSDQSRHFTQVATNAINEVSRLAIEARVPKYEIFDRLLDFRKQRTKDNNNGKSK